MEQRKVIELGVNIDHVATIRQARRTYEPDPVWAAVEAHLGGADGITVHLREDRRHIQAEHVRRLRELTHIRLNLEMAATDEMVGIACRIKPEMAMLVPEGRHEITTEGGLDIVSKEKSLKNAVKSLADAGSPGFISEIKTREKAVEHIRVLRIRFNAGHALNYFNVEPVARLPGVRELHIGHAIVSRAVFVGMREAVRAMKALRVQASR